MSTPAPQWRRQPRRVRWARRRRGSAMLFATLTMMVLTVAGMALAGTSLQALRISRMQQDSSAAFNLAESGSERAILYLRQQASPPAGTAPFDPFGGVNTLGTGKYQVTIDPDNNNPLLLNKRYLVRSTGTVNKRREIVEVYLQLGSFGRYAYFTDYETSSIASGTIYFKAGDLIDGPAHSNNTGGSDFNINWNGSNDPIFEDMVTSVSSQIDYTPRAPVSDTEWQRIFDSGSRGFRLGVNRVELPDTTDLQRNAAWGSTSGFPTATTGVFLASGSPDHGIYIRGDASLVFSVTPEGWQKIVVTQGSTVTTVTIRLNQNDTVVTRGTTSTTYAGTTNGVIYSTGNITALSGKLADSYMSGSTMLQRNAFTIATDVNNGKNITIANNLTYNTQPDRSQAWDSARNLKAAALGLVARNVIVSSSAPQNLTMDAVVLAGGKSTADGSFYVSNYSSKSPGTLTLRGGVIQKKRGPVGTFNPTTGTISTGYSKDYSYDTRMAVNPPPYFPTTGTYERLSFQRVQGGFAP